MFSVVLPQRDSRSVMEEKTWTIRRVSTSTIEMAKRAADQKGMKLGAWIDQQIIQNVEAPTSAEPERLNMELLEATQRVDQALIEQVQGLSDDIDSIIKGQHKLFLLVSDLVHQQISSSEDV